MVLNTKALPLLRGGTALRGLRPPRSDERQDLLDQPAGLGQRLFVAAGGRAQDEFGDSGGNISGDALDDRFGIANREMLLGVAAGAPAIGVEQSFESRIIGPAKAERDTSAVMVLVDRPAFGDSSRADRGDDGADIFGRFAAGLPAGAEPRGAPDRRLGRAADPHRQIRLHRLW